LRCLWLGRNTIIGNAGRRKQAVPIGLFRLNDYRTRLSAGMAALALLLCLLSSAVLMYLGYGYDRRVAGVCQGSGREMKNPLTYKPIK
jgi:hypothetical protein